ncbi:MAG: shikimate dehydrogenase [Deltaproteobacteria bacterium]|jgi:shikimate dehydrogenase|nr:shikimate dehydrogenase [Deltaproteobacteria bacterium]
MQERTSINPQTRVYALIGNPVSHSMSPAIHNSAFVALNLDCIYVAFQVEDVKGAMAGMRALDNFRGMSVTIPHKIEVMEYVDEIPDVDRFIGSINTVVKEDGKLIGFNTDGPGALKAITDAGVELKGKNVLMLGAGGAARAIAFTLAQKGAIGMLTLLDINEKLLFSLASDLESGTEAAIEPGRLNPETVTEHMAGADLIVNCTPVGMHPKEDATLVPAELFRPGQVVFDVVYNPLETKMLLQAKTKGLKVISGVEMFINQAILQFERFSGGEAPEELMRRVVMEKLSS